MPPEIKLHMSEIRFTQRKEQELNNKRSETHIVAKTIWSKGVGILYDLVDKYEHQGIRINQEMDIYPQIPREDQDDYLLAKNCIIFGISITALETAISEGKIADEDIVDPYNLTVQNTFEPRIKGHLSQYLSEKQLKELRKVAEKAKKTDRSLSFFYTGNFKDMPEVIRGFVSKYGHFPTIFEGILPYHRHGVTELAIENAKPITQDSKPRNP